MRGVSTIASLFFKFASWVYKKIGILGILVIALVIEIPILWVYYNENCSRYRIDNNTDLLQVKGYQELSYEELPEGEKEYYSDSRHYYQVTMEIANLYYKDDRIPRLAATDQNDNHLVMNYYDYYDDYKEHTKGTEFYAQSVIPSGIALDTYHILEVSDYGLADIETISFVLSSESYGKPNIKRQSEEKVRIESEFIP